MENFRKKSRLAKWVPLTFVMACAVQTVICSNASATDPDSLKVFENGNVSIGTATAPAEKLEVNGNVKANNFVKNDGTKVSGIEAVFVAQTPSQSINTIPVNDNYTVPFSIEISDPDGVYEHTTSVFTAPANGVYSLSLTASFIQPGNTSSDPLNVSIFCQSSSQRIYGYAFPYYHSPGDTTYCTGNVSATVYLQAGETCIPQLYKRTGGAGRVGYGEGSSNWSGFRVR